MNSKLKLAVCLSAALSTGFSLAQEASSAAATPSVAYVYVVSRPANASATEIKGYAAAPNGKLTPINGSPFQENEFSLTANGKYLFASNASTTDIDSFAIGTSGALRYVTSTNYAQFDPDDCGSAGSLFTDRTGTDLYPLVFDGDCANNFYQSYQVKEGSGELNYLGSVNGGAGSFNGIYMAATFLGNNLYAYEATNNGCMYFGGPVIQAGRQRIADFCRRRHHDARSAGRLSHLHTGDGERRPHRSRGFRPAGRQSTRMPKQLPAARLVYRGQRGKPDYDE
jgi:hypothetical protein